MRMLTAVLGLSLFALGASEVKAQDDLEWRPRLLGIGANFMASEGLNQFGELAGGGWGFTSGVTWMPSQTSNFGARLDLSLNVYDQAHHPTCLTTPCWMKGDMSITNGTFQFGIGPEWTISRGPVQPYLFATAGPSVFYTSLGLDWLCNEGTSGSYCSENYHSDWGIAARTGGGLRYHFNEALGLNLGFAYQYHGVRKYMIKGDLGLYDDGTVQVDNMRHSRANNLSFEVGLNFSVPRGYIRERLPF